MIVVQISMWPEGDVERAYELASAVIVNDGKGTETWGNYHAGFSRNGKLPPKSSLVRVVRFPRKRKNVWHLLALCLREAGYID